jgi:hypothetical protein
VRLAALFGRPIALPGGLVATYPELGGVRWRRGGLPPRIGGLFLGVSSVAAVTLWRTVFLAPDARLDAELLLHELRHVHQFEANAAFPLLYVWETLRHGYHGNRFEADARAYAAGRVRAAAQSHA